MGKDILPISVVIPCYKSATTIERAIKSLHLQTQLPSQVFLIDDASKDGSLDVLLEMQKTYPKLNIVVDSLLHNLGPGAARNRGWELATQPWIAFLDSDDAWHPEKLQLQWGWISTNPDAVLVGHQDAEIQSGEHLSSYTANFHNISPKNLKVSQIFFGDMLIANRFYTRTVMVQRCLPFRFSDRRYTEDYLLWLEIILAGYPSYVMQKELAFTFRPEFSNGGFSSQLWIHEKRELNAWMYLYSQHKISLTILFFALAWSYIKYLRRVCKRLLR